MVAQIRMKSLIVVLSFLISSACASPLTQRLSRAEGRIIGGDETEPFQYPFQCSIQVQVNNGPSQHVCGATVLSEYWILTAGHCVDLEIEGFTLTFQVWCGKWDLTVTEPGEQKIYAKRFVIHNNWTSIPEPFNFPWDIALIELESPLVFSDTVQPAQLPPGDYDPHLINDSILIGWGFYRFVGENGVVADRLRHVHVPLISIAQCNAIIGWQIGGSEHFACTGPLSGGSGGCDGDSGGAMVQWSGDTLYQTGIASWAVRPCGTENGPTGYLKTHLFVDWIEQNKVSSV